MGFKGSHALVAPGVCLAKAQFSEKILHFLVYKLVVDEEAFAEKRGMRHIPRAISDKGNSHLRAQVMQDEQTRLS